MAIVNVTPDSFYAGSRTQDEATIEKRVKQVVAQGCDIIDIGGYSSRPGAAQITVDEEWRRVGSGLKIARKIAPHLPVSIDTFRAEVARRALERYDDLIVNDISAGELDPDILDVVARHDAPYIAMHMRGTPADMQTHTDYHRNITDEVLSWAREKVETLRQKGIRRIILDPGFGFAKTLDQNYELLKHLHRLVEEGHPVLAGVSRKSMIYNLLKITPDQALAGTIALGWECLRQGASILRVHDVEEAVDTVKIFRTYDKSDGHS